MILESMNYQLVVAIQLKLHRTSFKIVHWNSNFIRNRGAISVNRYNLLFFNSFDRTKLLTGVGHYVLMIALFRQHMQNTFSIIQIAIRSAELAILIAASVVVLLTCKRSAKETRLRLFCEAYLKLILEKVFLHRFPLLNYANYEVLKKHEVSTRWITHWSLFTLL